MPLFFGAAFLISWVFWFLEPSLRGSDGISAGLLIKIGTYGPVLAAMLISALANPQRVPASFRLRGLAGGLVLVLAIYINWPTFSQLRSNQGPVLQWIVLWSS